MRALCAAWLVSAGLLPAAEGFPVSIRVNAARPRGELRAVWAFFGYDEPNYTYMPDGRKLLGQLAALSPVPVYVRAHNLLTSGDGTPDLKWGSTNAYTEDPAGRPIYDWTILDRIFDAWVQSGLKPLVEIGFMPEALSLKPQPYRHSFSLEGFRTPIWTGWAYPPKDYGKWAELVYQWARHAVERYGQGEVESWLWQAWNEPDIGYWQGTPEDYFKLHDYTAAAVRRALPRARIGGPHTTGPGSERAARFLRAFLEHTLGGRNYATGGRGSPLDYIGFHAKGRTTLVEGRVRMGIAYQLRDIDEGFRIAASYPGLRGRPVIIGESDPEGCAACSARVYPQNAYRNGPLYASYTAASFARKYDLAARHGVNFVGALTWAFQFEGQPWFDGFRSLATRGIPKAVLNVFRMFGRMERQRVQAESSQQAALDTLLREGVRGAPDVGVLASRGERRLTVLIWHYHDDDVAGPEARVRLELTGLPSGRRALGEHWRVDRDHSNAWEVWKRMGAPQQPTAEQYAALERAALLAPLEAARWLEVKGGAVRLDFVLPRQAVSLVELGW